MTFPAAAAILESIPEKDRQHPEVALMYAIVLEQQGKVEEALVGSARGPEVERAAGAIEGIGIHFTLGDLYDSLGRYDEAFEAYRLGNTNRKKAFFKFDRPTEPGAETTDRLIQIARARSLSPQLPTSTLDSECRSSSSACRAAARR